MPEMTKTERVACVFAHEIPDRVPVFDWVSHIGLIERSAGCALTLENSNTVIPLASQRLLDLAPLWLPANSERHVDDRGFTIQGSDWFNFWVVGYPWHDYDGMMAWVEGYVEELRSWQPPDRANIDRRRREQHALISLYGDTPVAGHITEPLETAFPAIGLENFIYLLVDRPELVQAWLDVMHTRNLRAINLGAEPGFDPTLYPVVCLTADVAFKGKTIFSPAYLRSSGYFARIAEVCRLYHEHGVKVLFHSDGNLTTILPDLVATGIDALNPIELAAGMDLEQIKEVYGKQLVLVGGVDGAWALPFGTPEDVRQATRQALRTAMPGGGFVLGSSGAEWLNGIPLENLEAMLETVWEYGRY